MIRIFLSAFFLLLFGQVYSQINFVNKAGIAGINHTYPIHMGAGGVSFVDFDGDGLDDLSLGTGPTESIHFYRNLGGSFQKIFLVQTSALIKSVLWADFDNDGDKDLFAVGFDDHNHLWENQGNLNLVEITDAAGLPMTIKRCYGANFADVNRDGWLDLYYAERKAAGEMTDNQMRLFLNNADGTFTDATDEWNAGDVGKTPFCATFFDCNNDKWPDLYIANDKATINTLLVNTGNAFEDKSDTSGTALAMNSMCVAISDFDKNSYTDIYVTNTEEGGALLVNEDGNSFSEQAGALGVSFAGGIGWGSSFIDADNDTWEDLYISGMIGGSDVLSSAFYQNSLGTFLPDMAQGFVGDTVTSFGNAIGDYNNDGFADIIVSNWPPAKAQLWSNETQTDNHWVKVELEGVLSNRDGIGAKVCVYPLDSDYTCHYTTCGIGFLGQNSTQLMFGLGSSTEIDFIEVTWPTGHIDMIMNPEIDQLHSVLEGSTTDGVIEVDDDITIVTDVQIEYPTFETLDIFPNPGSSQVFIQAYDKGVIDIIDVNGKYLRSMRIEGSLLDVSFLPDGIYFLKTRSGKVGKFVKS
ncbi:MAG: T9SS type A sorting domain-containing protein [Saprospiraceae bacterium]|nr:T9SS type A sorting domain-containing protein [Saprospiraceae bacterium]